MNTSEQRIRRLLTDLDEHGTYDATDLSTLLKRSIRTIWRMREEGELPAHIKIGRSVRWPRSTINQWIKDGCPPIVRSPQTKGADRG